MGFRFTRRIILFLLPPLLVLVGIVAVAWASGVAMPLPLMIERQLQDETVAIGIKTYEEIFRYRVEDLRIQRPEFIMLGSSTSRVLRPNLLHNTESYMDAGVGGSTLHENLAILRSLPEDYAPSLILLSIDVWRVNHRFTRKGASEWYLPYSELRSWEWAIQRLQQGTVDMMESWIVGDEDGDLEERRSAVAEWNVLGHASGSLYLQNGERLTPNVPPCCIADEVKLRQRRTNGYLSFLGLQRSTSRIWIGDDMRYETRIPILIEDIEGILQYAQDHEATVIGFISPMMPVIYEQIDGHSCYQTYPQAAQELITLFRDYEMPFINLLDPSLSNLANAYFIDEFHFTDLGGALVFRTLVEAFPELLEPYSSIEHLDALIESYMQTITEAEVAYVAAERDRLLAFGTIPTDVCPSQIES